MTREDRELLLKDLCARLPYGVKMNHIADDEHSPKTLIGIAKDMITLEGLGGYECVDIEDYKPYLLPLSSMTKEQKEFIKNRFCYDWDIDDHPYSLWSYCIEIGDADELIDFFNKNHIDYRGLIPMGLALDATDKNIY